MYFLFVAYFAKLTYALCIDSKGVLSDIYQLEQAFKKDLLPCSRMQSVLTFQLFCQMNPHLLSLQCFSLLFDLLVEVIADALKIHYYKKGFRLKNHTFFIA